MDDTPWQSVDDTAAPSGTGCVDCDSADPPGWWVHLRRCASCGHIGCCDTSPSQHATAHAAASGHRLIRSFEPGEMWFFDYVDQQLFEHGPDLAPPEHRPDTQPVPGPGDRVPADWADQLHN